MINLLPDKFKHFFRREAYYRQIIVWQILVLCLMIFCLGGIIYIYGLQMFEINLQKSVLNTIAGETSEINKSQENIRGLNQKVISVTNILNNKYYQEDIINEIAAYIPEGILLNSLSIDKHEKSYDVVLRGFAKDSDAIYSLKKSLEDAKKFKKISFPLDNLIKDKDIDFVVSFVISQNK